MRHHYMQTALRTLCILAFLLLITFSPSIHFINYIEFHDSQRVIQLILLAFILLDAIILGWSKTGTIPVSRKIKIGAGVILALSIASSINAIEPRFAVIEITLFVALTYYALFVARLFQENPEAFVKQLTYALLISIILYMVSFYTGYISAMVLKKTLNWPYPFYGFSNIRLFQQYQLWSLGLICIPLLSFDLKKNVHYWLYFALICWWVLLFYAASRGVILGWIIAMVATAIIYKKLAWPFLRIQIFTSFFGLCAYLVLFKIIPYLVTGPNTIVTSTIFRDTTYDRLDLWKVAYVMIKNFPLVGVGPMHFYHYNTFGTHPHNSVLQIASEWGLPATAIILWIVGYCSHCWYKRFNAAQIQADFKLNINLTIVLFFSVIASGAYSLVEGVIVMPISQVLMFTVIGMMIGQYTSGAWFKSSIITENKFHFRPIFAGIILVFLIWSVMPELVRGLKANERYFQPGERAFSMGTGTINPRIWMQQRRVEVKRQESKRQESQPTSRP